MTLAVASPVLATPKRGGRKQAQTAPAMTKLIIMPGPAFWAAEAVRTKMPVPMMAPIPKSVS